MKNLRRSTSALSFLVTFILLAVIAVACSGQSSSNSELGSQAIAVVKAQELNKLAPQALSQAELLLPKDDLLRLFRGTLTKMFNDATVTEAEGKLVISNGNQKIGVLDEVKVEGIAGDISSYYLIVKGKNFASFSNSNCKGYRLT